MVWSYFGKFQQVFSLWKSNLLVIKRIIEWGRSHDRMRETCWGRLFRGAAVYFILFNLAVVRDSDTTKKHIPWLNVNVIVFYCIICEWHHDIWGVRGQVSFSSVCTISKWWDSSERTQGPEFFKYVKSAKGQAEKEGRSYNFVLVFELGTVRRWAYSRSFLAKTRHGVPLPSILQVGEMWNAPVWQKQLCLVTLASSSVEWWKRRQ